MTTATVYYKHFIKWVRVKIWEIFHNHSQYRIHEVTTKR